MKKQIAIIAMLVICVGASAQLRTSRTVFTQPKAEKVKTPARTDWYIKAGISINNIDISDYCHLANIYDQYPQIGFAVDGGFNYYFSGSNFYCGAELGIGTSGAVIDGCIQDGNYTPFETTLSAYNIQATPKVGYMLPLGTSDCAIDFHVGPYATWDFTRGATDSWYWDGNDPVQVGAQAGIGFWYKKFNFDASFQHGFLPQGYENRSWYDEEYHAAEIENQTSYNIRLRVGYAF